MLGFTVLPRILLFTTLVYNVHAINDIDLALQRRQNVPIGTGVTPTSSPTTPNSPSATSPSPSNNASPPTTTSTPTSTPSSASVATTPTSPAQNSRDTTSPTSTPSNAQSSKTASAGAASNSGSSGVSSSASGGTSPGSSDTGSSRHTTTGTPSTSVISSTQRVVTTIHIVSGSTTLDQVLTTSALVPVSTSVTTPTPGLAGGDSNSNSSGLSSSSKRIIIGVVVGIGGAIVLGGLAVVAWRIWGRKRHVGDEDNDLMDSHPGSSGHEKTSSVNGNSPFKSTLDQYHTPHNPPGPVNTASNF